VIVRIAERTVSKLAHLTQGGENSPMVHSGIAGANARRLWPHDLTICNLISGFAALREIFRFRGPFLAISSWIAAPALRYLRVLFKAGLHLGSHSRMRAIHKTLLECDPVNHSVTRARSRLCGDAHCRCSLREMTFVRQATAIIASRSAR
jgi:hypothetical protein